MCNGVRWPFAGTRSPISPASSSAGCSSAGSSPTTATGTGRKRPSADSIDDLLVYCAFGVIIGGRLGNVLFYDPQYYFSHPVEIFKVWEGGMAFHGGLIGALIGALLFCRRYEAPV